MDDAEIRNRIEALEDEEKRLRHDEEDAADHDRDDIVAADADRLAAIKVELDQLWDLLRRRQAARDGGQDPDAVTPRDEGTVEGYLGRRSSAPRRGGPGRRLLVRKRAPREHSVSLEQPLLLT
jgi:hypothetical protein